MDYYWINQQLWWQKVGAVGQVAAAFVSLLILVWAVYETLKRNNIQWKIFYSDIVNNISAEYYFTDFVFANTGEKEVHLDHCYFITENNLRIFCSNELEKGKSLRSGNFVKIQVNVIDIISDYNQHLDKDEIAADRIKKIVFVDIFSNEYSKFISH